MGMPSQRVLPGERSYPRGGPGQGPLAPAPVSELQTAPPPPTGGPDPAMASQRPLSGLTQVLRGRERYRPDTMVQARMPKRVLTGGGRARLAAPVKLGDSIGG